MANIFNGENHLVGEGGMDGMQPPEVITMNMAETANGHGGGSHSPIIITRFILLKPPVTVFDVIPFGVVFFIYCIIFHTAFSLIKKFSKSTHSILQFCFVILFPPLIMLFTLDYFFIGMWLVLICFFLYCMRISFSKTLLRSKNPKRIYRMFKNIFIYTNFFIVIGQILILFSFFFKMSFITYSFKWLIYSLYFAVFCREVMSNLSKIMGKTTGVIPQSILGDYEEDMHKCMVCMDPLIKTHHFQSPSVVMSSTDTTHDSSKGGQSLNNNNNNTSNISSNRSMEWPSGKIFTNSCNHSFHIECIKGWIVIGNNYHCISCQEPIKTEMIKPNLWDKTEVAVKPLMNFLRSGMSFFVVACIYIYSRT